MKNAVNLCCAQFWLLGNIWANLDTFPSHIISKPVWHKIFQKSKKGYILKQDGSLLQGKKKAQCRNTRGLLLTPAFSRCPLPLTVLFEIINFKIC